MVQKMILLRTSQCRVFERHSPWSWIKLFVCNSIHHCIHNYLNMESLFKFLALKNWKIWRYLLWLRYCLYDVLVLKRHSFITKISEISLALTSCIWQQLFIHAQNSQDNIASQLISNKPSPGSFENVWSARERVLLYSNTEYPWFNCTDKYYFQCLPVRRFRFDWNIDRFQHYFYLHCRPVEIMSI